MNEIEELRIQLAASNRPQPAAVPDGWKPFPVVPTDEMLEPFARAATNASYKGGHDVTPDMLLEEYQAMLQAVPSPP